MKGHQRVAVQQHTIPAGGDQHGNDCLHVLLVQVLMLAAQVQHTFFVRTQAVERLVVSPLEPQPGVVGLPIDDLAHVPRADAHAINVLIVLGHGCVVEHGNGHLDRLQCLAATGRFAGQQTPLTVPIGERRGLPVDFDRQLGRGKQQALRRLLDGEADVLLWLRDDHEARPGAEFRVQAVADADGAGCVRRERQPPLIGVDVQPIGTDFVGQYRHQAFSRLIWNIIGNARRLPAQHRCRALTESA